MVFLLGAQVAGAAAPRFSSRVISYSFCQGCALCSGIILNPKTILSAAHCETKTRFHAPMEMMSISMHNAKRDRHALKRVDYRLYPHPDYREGSVANDLMVIKFQKELPLAAEMAPLRLVQGGSLQGEFWSEGIGGLQSYGATRRTHPLKLNRVRDDGVLIFVDGSPHPGEPSRRQGGICIGDSGGATFVRPAGGGAERELVAMMVSVFERDFLPLCSPRIPSLHVWLYPHLDWIGSFLRSTAR